MKKNNLFVNQCCTVSNHIEYLKYHILLIYWNIKLSKIKSQVFYKIASVRACVIKFGQGFKSYLYTRNAKMASTSKRGIFGDLGFQATVSECFDEIESDYNNLH